MEVPMIARFIAGFATLCLLFAPVFAQGAAKPTDPHIAHIAYTAGQIDIEAAKQALEKSKTRKCVTSRRTWYATMLR
jgi:putative membrane protein